MLDLAYKVIQTILAKDRNGFITPEEFNNSSFQAIDEIYRGYFEEENRDKVKENRGLTNRGYSNLSFNQRQRIDHFAKTSVLAYNAVDLRYDLPSDLYMIEDKGIVSSNGKVIEEVQRHNIGYLNNSISSSTALYPTYENVNTYINVFPSTITTNITVRYLRTILKPNWTYQEVNGDPLFDPSNSSFQDIDLHASEFSNFVVRVLSYLSINLKEYEVTKISQDVKNDMQLKDNS
jgi:hypothetical protein